MRPGQAAPVFLGPGEQMGAGPVASMRPGQAAPVFPVAPNLVGQLCLASMRPGQAAPVFRPHRIQDASAERKASMRPGQAAPVFVVEGAVEAYQAAALQ